MPFKSLLIALMLCIPGALLAQTEIYTIYLKNGTTYKGTLVEKIPGETITIRTAENEVLKLSYDDIQRTTNTAAEEQAKAAKPDSSGTYSYKKRGYIAHLEGSFLLGFGSVSGIGQQNEDRGFGLRWVNGYQFSETMAIGFGLGVEKYLEALLIPMTLDIRATLIKGKTSPTINVNAGYAPNSKGFNEGGGFVFNPSIGIKSYVSHKTAFIFNIGFKAQQDQYSYYAGGNFVTKQKGSAMFKFVNFSLGLSF
ncbi:MAG TPA: hypothetical protein VK151_02090 [Fluviicola sp.]|nr:hypothetical protein [Fluviicola sp.]